MIAKAVGTIDGDVIRLDQPLGLPVSNQPVKNNVFWGYNTIRDCVPFGAQHLRRNGRDRTSLYRTRLAVTRS